MDDDRVAGYIRDAIKSHDKDGDGALSADELAAHEGKTLDTQTKLTQQAFKQYLDQNEGADTDGAKQEQMADFFSKPSDAMTKSATPGTQLAFLLQHPKNLQHRFARADKDKNGKISVDEMESVVNPVSHLSDKQQKRLFWLRASGLLKRQKRRAHKEKPSPVSDIKSDADEDGQSITLEVAEKHPRAFLRGMHFDLDSLLPAKATAAGSETNNRPRRHSSRAEINRYARLHPETFKQGALMRQEAATRKHIKEKGFETDRNPDRSASGQVRWREARAQDSDSSNEDTKNLPSDAKLAALIVQDMKKEEGQQAPITGANDDRSGNGSDDDDDV